MKYTIEKTHITTIKPGDTVKHNGELKTVCNSDMARGFMGFMGLTMFGDSYNLGTLPVLKVTFS